MKRELVKRVLVKRALIKRVLTERVLIKRSATAASELPEAGALKLLLKLQSFLKLLKLEL